MNYSNYCFSRQNINKNSMAGVESIASNTIRGNHYFIKESKYELNIAFCSMLTRAEVTCKALLKASGQTTVPIKKCWRMKETCILY